MRIDQSNYESFLLSYIDGELTADERQQLELYCQSNPEVAQELRLLQQTVLVPPQIVFEQKESLYREEEKRRVIGWYLWRAAVIVVLMGAAFFYWYLRPGDNKLPAGTEIAVVTDSGQGAKLNSAENKSGTESRTGAVPDSSAAGIKPAATVKSQSEQGSSSPESASATEQKMKPGKTVKPAGKGVLPPGGNSPAAREKPAGLSGNSGGNNSVAGAVEPEDVPTATASRLDITTAGKPEINAGTAIPVRGSGSLKDIAAAQTAVETAREVAASTDRAADSEAGNTEGNDAVSVVHLTKSKVSVRRLFRRLAGSNENNNQAENTGEKKVNISVFQFALGK